MPWKMLVVRTDSKIHRFRVNEIQFVQMRFEVLAMFIIILMRSWVLAHVDLLIDANILEKHAVSMKS
jgi:hypothetical protein